MEFELKIADDHAAPAFHLFRRNRTSAHERIRHYMKTPRQRQWRGGTEPNWLFFCPGETKVQTVAFVETSSGSDEILFDSELNSFKISLMAATVAITPVARMTADAHGNFPAIQTGRVSIAHEVIRRRQRLSLSQKDLALSAGIRVETLNRVEKAKVTADTATISKIDRALKRAEKLNGKPS